MKSSELANAYREFFKGELGKDLLARIDIIYDRELKKATGMDKEASWAQVNRAAGIDSIRAEFKRVVSLDKIGGGRK